MPLHYEGYQETRKSVQAITNETELLELLDDLFGRDSLPEDYDFFDLKNEALGQLDKEWRTPEGRKREETTQFWLNVMAAKQRYGY